MHLARIARRRYTPGPTPIEHLPRLSELLGGPRIYLKRDDQLGLTAGGNKTRKLEFLMAEALRCGADTVITTGAVQSNHCRLTLAAAIKEGLRCKLVLEERIPGSYDPSAGGNNLLIRLLGAEDVAVMPGGTDMNKAMEQVAEDVRSAGGTPYIIPSGGSNALGALGYVACAEEILAQTYAMSLSVDHVVCASGSGGTHAGLVAGLYGNQAGIPLTGISVRADRQAQTTKVHALANAAAQLAGATQAVPRDAIVVRDEYIGPGYSLPTPEMVEAVQVFARTEGVLLDPVYTGKAAAGLIGMIRHGVFGEADAVLFLHTGGSPALYVQQDTVLGTSHGSCL